MRIEDNHPLTHLKRLVVSWRNVQIFKAYRFALEPNAVQAKALASWAPALRFVYNWMLAQRRDAYLASEGRVRIGYGEQTAQLPAMKKMFPLAWSGAQPAFAANAAGSGPGLCKFLRRTGRISRVQNKEKGQSRDPLAARGDGERPGGAAAQVGMGQGKDIEKGRRTDQSATVTFDGLRWQVSILAEIELAIPKPAGGQVGIDMGVRESLALSDGRLIRLPVATPREEKRHRLLARRVSRCLQGSRRHEKAKRRLLLFRRRISHRVDDTRHKLTSELAKNHGLVVVEALTLKSLTRSAGARSKPLG